MNSIGAIVEELSSTLGVPVITPEYEIVQIPLQEGPLPTEELFGRSSLSRSGFFHAIGRLKQRCCLEASTNADDRRGRTYSLTPRSRELMLHNLRALHDGRQNPLPLPPTRRHRNPDRASPAGQFISLSLHEGDVRPPHFSCEFQILLVVLFDPGVAAGEIARHVMCSDTRFYAALRKLADLGLIQSDAGADRRGDRHRPRPRRPVGRRDRGRIAPARPQCFMSWPRIAPAGRSVVWTFT